MIGRRRAADGHGASSRRRGGRLLLCLLGLSMMRGVMFPAPASGGDPVPGVTDNEVRVGMLFPARGPLSTAAPDVQALLTACFKDLDARGGLFGRSLVLVPLPFDPDRPDAAAEAARKVAREGRVFCLVADRGLSPGDNASRILAEAGIPVVAPFVATPGIGKGVDGLVFYIYPGLFDEARVLVDFAADKLSDAGKDSLALLYPDDDAGRSGAEGAREQAARRGLAIAAEESYAPGAFDAAGAAGRLEKRKAGIVMFFGGPAEATEFLTVAGRAHFVPYFLAPVVTVGTAPATVDPQVARKVYLSSPGGAPDSGSRGLQEFFRILSEHKVPQQQGPSIIPAFAGAMLIEEGLRLSGRSVTRSGFVKALSTLTGFRTGVTPPISFDEHRRIGARGSGILTPNPRGKRLLLPHVEWREPQ